MKLDTERAKRILDRFSGGIFSSSAKGIRAVYEELPRDWKEVYSLLGEAIDTLEYADEHIVNTISCGSNEASVETAEGSQVLDTIYHEEKKILLLILAKSTGNKCTVSHRCVQFK